MTYHYCQYCDTRMPANALKCNRARYFCRTEIACFNRLLFRYRDLVELERIGEQMANVCFHLSQGAIIDRGIVAELYRRWDEIARNTK